MNIIEKYPNKFWIWTDISRNPGITMNDIVTHVQNNRKSRFCFRNVSKNPNLNIETILNLRKERWDFEYISANPGITIRDIITHSDLPWRWDNIFQNEFTTDKNMYIDTNYYTLLLVFILNCYHNSININNNSNCGDSSSENNSDSNSSNDMSDSIFTDTIQLFYNEYLISIICNYV